MGNFKIALGLTMNSEGGYNHGVGENETFFGIDRGYNFKWSGWLIVDKIKAANPGKTDRQLDVIFKQNLELMNLKDRFYKTDYWDTLCLDLINDQQVCNILFDDNVNPCEISASHVLQSAVLACGVLIVIDGKVGVKTINAVNSINPKTYYNAVVEIRKFHYNHEVVKVPKQRQWLKSWLSRLPPYQEAIAA